MAHIGYFCSIRFRIVRMSCMGHRVRQVGCRCLGWPRCRRTSWRIVNRACRGIRQSGMVRSGNGWCKGFRWVPGGVSCRDCRSHRGIGWAGHREVSGWEGWSRDARASRRLAARLPVLLRAGIRCRIRRRRTGCRRRIVLRDRCFRCRTDRLRQTVSPRSPSRSLPPMSSWLWRGPSSLRSHRVPGRPGRAVPNGSSVSPAPGRWESAGVVHLMERSWCLPVAPAPTASPGWSRRGLRSGRSPGWPAGLSPAPGIPEPGAAA